MAPAEVSEIVRALPADQRAILELSSVLQVQSNALQPLVQAASEAKRLGTPLFMVAGESLRTTLKLKGLDGLFKIHPTLLGALAALEEATTRIMLSMPRETRFLVADKIRANRDLLKDQLARLGIANVSEAEGAREALQKMKLFLKTGDPVGFVFSEWDLPEMSGVEFLRSVRDSADFQDLPFILVTSNPEPDQLPQAEELGLTQHLVRPIDPEELLRAINEGWRRHNPSVESEFWDI